MFSVATPWIPYKIAYHAGPEEAILHWSGKFWIIFEYRGMWEKCMHP